jgi:hypothetical protein
MIIRGCGGEVKFFFSSFSKFQISPKLKKKKNPQKKNFFQISKNMLGSGGLGPKAGE